MSLASRERLLAGLAILALLVAAFAMPPLDAAASGPDADAEGDGQGDGEPGPTTPGEGSPDATDRTVPGEDRSVEDGQTIDGEPGQGAEPGGRGEPTGETDVSVRARDGASPGDGGEGGLNVSDPELQESCYLVVWDRLVPGHDATVVQWHDAGPVASQRVWFDEHPVGATDDAGRVDGEVPYVHELPVTAEAPPVDSCSVLHLEMETPLDEWRQTNGGTAEVLVGDDASIDRVDVVDGNASVTLPVAGEAALAIEGEPYPGEEVRVNATVAGEPMPDATVTLDGEPVGETDDRGQANVTVPDDGSAELTVAVERGEFRAAETVDVLVLSLAVQPDALLALPGGSATAQATLGDRPAADVQVTTPRTTATTGEEGGVAIALPGDPRAVIEAEGHGQTARAPVWPAYVPTALAGVLGLGLVVGGFGVAARREDRPAVGTVAAGWVAVAAVAAAWGLVGPGAATVVAALLALGVLACYRERAAAILAVARASLVSLGWRIHAAAVWLADALGLAADGLQAVVPALLARLRASPRSIRAVLGLAARWLAALPRRLGRRVAAVAGTVAADVRRLADSLGRVGTLVTVALAVALVGLGYIFGDVPGGLAGLVAALLVVVLVARRQRRAVVDAVRGSRSGTGGGDGGAGGAGEGSTARPTLRQCWRTFARWVVPGRWRARTPGEVARTAVDRGFPREPVEHLTEVFREVEYGDRRLSEDRWGRARTAFETLRTARSDEDGDER